jgi:hypothetical protein
VSCFLKNPDDRLRVPLVASNSMIRPLPDVWSMANRKVWPLLRLRVPRLSEPML